MLQMLMLYNLLIKGTIELGFSIYTRVIYLFKQYLFYAFPYTKSLIIGVSLLNKVVSY